MVNGGGTEKVKCETHEYHESYRRNQSTSEWKRAESTVDCESLLILSLIYEGEREKESPLKMDNLKTMIGSKEKW